MKSKLIFILPFLIFFLLFILKQNILIDTDFGWHLKGGEYILTKGIPKTDPFSYSMPSYPAINHEWLVSVGIAILYPLIKIGGLAVLFSLIAIVAVVFVIYRCQFGVKHKYILITLISTVLSVLFISVGIRAQVITWLFLALFLFILDDENRKEKYWHGLIILMLFWVNLHGGFPVGLLVLLIEAITRSIEKRAFQKKYFYIFVFALLITIINPYGLRIWSEVWATVGNQRLHWSINEWRPLFSFFDFTFFLYSVFSIALFIKFQQKFSLKEKILYYLFLLLSVSSIRHIPLWLIVSCPITVKCLSYFEKEANSVTRGKKRLNLLLTITSVIFTIGIVIQMGINLKDLINLTESKLYPKKAINYLKTIKIKGNVFSIYNWGGYLIWKLPEKKVFIDGRMPTWMNDKISLNESKDALRDYFKILNQANEFKKARKKYQINLVLIPRNLYQKTNTITNGDFITKIINFFQVIFKSENSQIENPFLKMKKIYSDEIAEIYITD